MHGVIDREVRLLRNVNDCLVGDQATCSPYASVVRNRKRVVDISAVVTSTSIPGLTEYSQRLPPPCFTPWQCERYAAELDIRGDHFHAECLWRRVFEAEDIPEDLLKHTILALAKTNMAIGDPYRAEEYRAMGNSRWPSLPEFHQLPPPARCAVRSNETKLYLGAGTKTLPGYLTVDLVGGETVDIALDLDRTPWPWADNSVASIVAEDLVEHLGINLIEFCEEAWRVLRPGGLMFIRTPHCEGESSWIDPTHRWHYDTRSFEFLDPATHWGQHHPHYSDRKWRILSLGVRGPQNIHACMTPRKPSTT